ncbi:uncharacterized protein LOC133814500 [Humulus lupulus]|uniref:uncharacterized protein LOC133814500 n=1 Tax=Humulus lupulus TaxID=3486 RepID=UPI002B40D4EF|nr:uncharacterized protein LOC133814500 [Humulus lupulus]
MNQKQHIETIVSKQSNQARRDYRTCLTTTTDCVWFLLRQGILFRGSNESEDSRNQGNFLEVLKFLSNHNSEIKVSTLKHALENLKLTSPKIQKDITNAFVVETINTIIKDIEDGLFSIIFYESHNASMKKQMTIVLRCVDKNGRAIERLIGVEHVTSTITLALKTAIDRLFSRHGLSISRLWGRGYDGASNIQGEFNGLKTLILNENPCAFYIHCFAHQLQAALVAIAKKHYKIASFFGVITNVFNVVGAFYKCSDILQEKQDAIVVEALQNGEITSGKGLNQQTRLKHPRDTSWGSHYGTLVSLITMFSSTTDVLEEFVDSGSYSDQKCEAKNLIRVHTIISICFFAYI